uniref:Trehalase n=1 Tax=Blattella germanica TaxID=6973 RepID=A0A076JZN4_BLAGE|nr:trehalase [Blattella germanica]
MNERGTMSAAKGVVVILAATFLLGVATCEELPQSCDSEIYCYGELLKTVQLANIYPDSKTFVDMHQKDDPSVTLKKFETLMEETGRNPNREQIQQFVDDAFDSNDILEYHTPSDWTDHPSVLQQVVDSNYRRWVLDLNEIWKNLTRRMQDSIKEHPERHSIIYVPNPFVIPGGRFKEFYYWDTYWIVQGLLLCDMTETTRGIIENFLSVVATYGHIPNGGRVYYIQRSQPPMLTPMVDSYYERTKNLTFIKNNIDLLEKEFDFWLKERLTTVEKDGKQYTLARYYAPSEGPRPESFSEDCRHAESIPNEEEKTQFYINIKSAAESGWDFSSRWFIYQGTNGGNLTHINTQNIIPVDLNAFIYWNAVLLAKFNTLLGNTMIAQDYMSVAEEIKAGVAAVLWNEEWGTWLDYDMINNKPREYFYPSNLAPLWTYCYDLNNVSYYAKRSVEYISNESIRNYLGGIPASLELSNEQWDFPNAWPPLQSIAIQGLAYTNDEVAKNLAFELANNWVKSNYKGFEDSKAMFEKYDAQHPGKYGGGGEYVVQSGFGWTNGVILEFLNTYGKEMNSKSVHNVRRRNALK